MSSMQFVDKHDVKVVRWHEPERATAFSVLLCRVNTDDNQALKDAGYGPSVMFFASIDPGTMTFSWKPRTFARKSGATQIKELLAGLVNGDDEYGPLTWDELRDGETYTPDVYDE